MSGQVVKRASLQAYSQLSTDALREQYRRKCALLRTNKQEFERREITERRFFYVMKTTKNHIGAVMSELRDRGESV